MIQIRDTLYRGSPGFLVCGTDPKGRPVGIFTRTRETAEHLKEKLTDAEDITAADFNGDKET